MADRDYLLLLLGALGFIILSHQIPILRQLGTTNITLEDIEGIDLQSLSLARQNYEKVI